MNDDRDLIALTEFGQPYADLSVDDQKRVDDLLDQMQNDFEQSN